MTQSQIRKEVMAEVIQTWKAAEDRGEDAWRAVERAYPGIPSDVLAEAMMAAGADATEAWWQSLERTIDGEVIRNALAGAERAS